MQALYLTHSINTDISSMIRAGGAVFDLAGHGEEEVKVFSNAVQLADVFICTQNICKKYIQHWYHLRRQH